MKLSHEFVEFIPDHIEPGSLMISLKFNTAIHKCPCGCGQEVVTPLSPAQWQLIYNGESVSLKPSIGNWSFDCKSHYWIRNNQIEWAERWSPQKIEHIQRKDQNDLDKLHQEKINPDNWIQRFSKWFLRK